MFGLEVITVGQALEAAAQSLGNKLLGVSDAAAIQSAQGSGSKTKKGSVAATAQSAAWTNSRASTSVPGFTLGKIMEVASLLS